MNYHASSLATASLVALTGCIQEEPPEDTETTGSSDSRGDDPPTPGSCEDDRQENFTWAWDFGAHEPTLDEGWDDYAYDAPALIECEPTMFEEDADSLTLGLDCSVGDAPVEPQTLSLSPIPASVLEALERSEPLSVAFRPEQVCNNACRVSRSTGWLSIRAADERLLLGIADVARLLEPVDELAPIELSTASSSCTPLEDTYDCEVKGWQAPLVVTASDGAASTALTGAGTAMFGDYALIVNTAYEGEWDHCTDDAGERHHVQLLVLLEDAK